VKAQLFALGAIALWVSVASLGVLLKHLPPFLLTGLSLLIGGLLAMPQVLRDPRQWRIPLSTLALGIYGLFGYHFMLFMALRMAPVLLKNISLRPIHLGAALLGFGGAALAILGAANPVDALPSPGSADRVAGYLAALAAAFMWSSYSLLTQRVAAFPTAAIGLFALVSGLLSLLCHWVLEAPTSLSLRDGLLLALMGLGPLGGAFYLWDKALKLGDARQIGILSYLTPLGSTAMLILVTGRQWSWSIALAALMIMLAALLGTRAR
jgi:drug/metabolite transporter (DMT)-like permease